VKIDLLTEPVPHEEARRFIAGKTPTSRAVFDRMLPELRGRAFVVSGIEDANLLQRFRDRIADLPQGGDWDAIRQEIAEDLVPFFVDPQAGGEEMQKQIEAAHRRAELLVRTHGFQAYAATRYRDQMANRDIHPWWQYKAFGDGRVRETHQALDGLVFPAGHDFWKDHYPPWDWGCRCIVIGLSPEVVDRMRAQDAGKAPDERRVIEGEVLERALETGRLQRGPNRAIDLRSPVERAEGAQARNVAYRWNPGELAPNLEQLRDRYDPPVWAEFERWAKRTEIEKGQTVWEWASAPHPEVFRAAREAEEVLFSRQGGAEAARAGAQANAAEIMAVLEGRKPMFHEGLGEALAEQAADALRSPLRGWARVDAFGGHLVVYAEALLRRPGTQTPAQIRALVREQRMGVLLGYGAETMLAPGTVPVHIYDGDTLLAGFNAPRELAEALAQARLQDYARYLGRHLRYEIKREQP
jgi:SPP1 gp7 family putative phage head morphogenesis protein